MPDYKEMYLTLFRASEEAVNLLIAAQQACEEMYLSAPETQWLTLEGGESRRGGTGDGKTPKG